MRVPLLLRFVGFHARKINMHYAVGPSKPRKISTNLHLIESKQFAPAWHSPPLVEVRHSIPAIAWMDACENRYITRWIVFGTLENEDHPGRSTKSDLFLITVEKRNRSPYLSAWRWRAVVAEGGMLFGSLLSFNSLDTVLVSVGGHPQQYQSDVYLRTV